MVDAVISVQVVLFKHGQNPKLRSYTDNDINHEILSLNGCVHLAKKQQQKININYWYSLYLLKIYISM